MLPTATVFCYGRGMSDVKNPTGFIRRGDTFYVRLFVPVDVRSEFGGKEEVWRSLRTQDRSVALQKYRIEQLRFDQEIADKRLVQTQATKEATDAAEIERKVELYFYQLMTWDDESRLRGLSVEQFDELETNVDEALGDFKEGMKRNDAATVEPEVEEFLAVHPEIKVTKGTEAYQRMIRAIYRANVRSLEVVRARNQGDYVETLKVEKAIGGIRLLQAFDSWATEHRGPNKTVDEFRAHLNRFVSLHTDLPIASITKEHVRTFKEAMTKYPAKLSNAERKLSVAEILKRYEGKEVARLSPNTVNEKYLGPLKAILAHSVANGLLDHNPATGIRAKVEKVKKPPRVSLSDTDIQTVLSFPVFTQGHRPAAGAGEAAKWLPLLAMLTGARLEELARLKKDDLQTEGGVRFLAIHDVVKTQGSLRKVPIHSKLIELGFLEFAKSVDSGPLFPLMAWHKEKVSDAWSKWWTRYRRANGLEDDRKVFHSFRHTVKRNLRNAGVDKSLRDAIMGHDADDVAEAYGLDEEGIGFALTTLRDALEKLAYPALDAVGHKAFSK
jgi:integrase